MQQWPKFSDKHTNSLDGVVSLWRYILPNLIQVLLCEILRPILGAFCIKTFTNWNSVLKIESNWKTHQCATLVSLQLWQFLTKGPVFSSPCVTPDQQKVLCGSHDGCLYCLNCADGSLLWTFQTSGKVYASACVFDGSAVGRRGILVGLASTDGTVWILDVQDGQMLASFTLPGELFSSPVVWEQSLVVGCRNDYVYCLKLTVKEET